MTCRNRVPWLRGLTFVRLREPTGHEHISGRTGMPVLGQKSWRTTWSGPHLREHAQTDVIMVAPHLGAPLLRCLPAPKVAKDPKRDVAGPLSRTWWQEALPNSWCKPSQCSSYSKATCVRPRRWRWVQEARPHQWRSFCPPQHRPTRTSGIRALFKVS